MFKLTDSELDKLDAKNTTKEIKQQPELWQESFDNYKEKKEVIDSFIEDIKNKHDNLRVIFTGAGTSAYVGDTVTPYLREKYKNTALSFESIATTTLVSTPYQYLEKEVPTILVSFARSGNSPESVAAVDTASDIIDDFYQVTITCSKDGKLAQKAQGDDKNLVILMPERANDQGFAMTGAFTTMTLSTLLVFDPIDYSEKESFVKAIIKEAVNVLKREDTLMSIADKDISRIVYLGSGSLEGLSKEAQLKMLELTAGEVVTAYESPLGFRHGPKSIVNEKTALVVFNSTNAYTRQYDEDLLNELHADQIAETIWSLTPDAQSQFEGNTFLFNETDVKMPDAYLALPYILFAQTLALMTSVKLKNKPDNPSPTGTVNRVVKGVTIHKYK
ncbi:MAG: SIS domain-containing protein [Alkalibacterium gilvum]|uniref:SIS domain-containing protein n=1 Tax=Alkalibacterium gilvum TaxID=1130080 RepID=UPI002653CCE8|nr:SIS domain-containing protein [Alkalibacterium sp.]MDN6310737.1 SIS domain-containing protein [Psychroflexus sp.]